jgi:ribose 5-phosphate isomerase A
MSNAQDAEKRAAALAALAEVSDAVVLGLGTGSTVRYFIDAVGDLVKQGRKLSGVCTSAATRAHAAALGIPLLSDDGPWTIDVTVDGADEFDSALSLSKGGGGALTREKIVSFASKRTVIVCDASKRVGRLGETRPVALEILAFAHGTTLRHLAAFGRPVLRMSGGSAARTDGGNLLVDLAIEPTADPAALDRALHAVPGVVETGLFIGRADVVLVATSSGVERVVRADARAGH